MEDQTALMLRIWEKKGSIYLPKDIGYENQIPPGIPIGLFYDVLIDTEQEQEGLVRVANKTINRHMDVVMLTQIVDENNFIYLEDTQMTHIHPLGSEEGGDTSAVTVNFDVSSLKEGRYNVVSFAWPKGFKDQRTSAIPHSFVIGNPSY